MPEDMHFTYHTDEDISVECPAKNVEVRDWQSWNKNAIYLILIHRGF